MGSVINLLKRKLKNVELRILSREAVEFILFPNVEMNYRMNLKQEYVQGVEKMDTNAWEVDLLTEKTGNLAQKLKEKMTQAQGKKTQKVFLEENMEAEMEQKQLRKIQSKISGLKNRLNERSKQIETQKTAIKSLRLVKDKMALQCDIMKQMIRQEQEKYEMYRNFDFTYVTKSYKLTETSKKVAKKINPNSQNSRQASNSITPNRPQFTQNLQVSIIKQLESGGRRRDSTRLIQQYIQEDSTPRRSPIKGNKQITGFTLEKQD